MIENGLTAVRGEGLAWGWMKRVKGLSKRKTKKQETHRHRQQHGDYQREKRVRGNKRGYGGDKW